MAYFAHVNATGGVNGLQIRIKAYDDAYDPTKAILNSIKLIEEDRVFLLFNYVGTPTVTRVLPVLTRFSERQMYLFFPFTGAEPQRAPPYNRLAFNLRASYGDETAELVNYFMVTNRKRIGIFYQVDAYGRSGWDGVRKALQNHGTRIAAETTYRRGAPYSARVAKQVDILRAANVDAVISIGAYAAAAAFGRDATDAGWDMSIANVSFVGSESMLELLLAEGARTGKDYTRRLVNSQVVPSYEDLATRRARVSRAHDEVRARPERGARSVGTDRDDRVGLDLLQDGDLAVEALGVLRAARVRGLPHHFSALLRQRLARADPAAPTVGVGLVEDGDACVADGEEVVDQPLGLLLIRCPQVDGQPVVWRLALGLRAGKGKEEAEVQLLILLQARQHAGDRRCADVVEEEEHLVLLHQFQRVLDRSIRLIVIVVRLDRHSPAVDAAGAIDLRQVRHRAPIQLDAEAAGGAGERRRHADDDFLVGHALLRLPFGGEQDGGQLPRKHPQERQGQPHLSLQRSVSNMPGF